MTHLKNERGAAFIIELALVAVVLAVIGFALHASMQAKIAQKHEIQPDSSPQPTKSTAPDVTANWPTYTSATGSFSVRYSPSWKVYTYVGNALATCQKGRADNTLDLDTQKSTTTEISGCGGGPLGQVHISSSVGAKNVSFSDDGSLYTGVTSQTVSVAGVEGVRYAGVSLQNLPQLEKGGTTVEYHFYANGRNYSLVMEQHLSSRDISRDFDLMVKTIRFSS